MRWVLATLVLFGTLSAQVNESDFPSFYRALRGMLVSSSLSDTALFNSYYLSGNPLGLLNRNTSSQVELITGYRNLVLSGGPSNLKSEYSGWLLPTIILRPSQKVNVMFNYSNNPIKQSDSSQTLSLPLHQFGFSFTGRSENNVLKGGIAGQGFLGDEKSDRSDNMRALLGVKDVGVCVGSAINPSVDVDAYLHAAGLVDTLFSANNNWPQERFGMVQFPLIDLNINVSPSNVPNKTDFFYTFARKHFVYTQKANPSQMVAFNTIAGTNGDSTHWDGDPIVNDSMVFNLQDIYMVDLKNDWSLYPAISLGYMHNWFKRMKPGSDNNPMSYAGDKKGYEWETSSFRFGLGGAIKYQNLTKVWLDFSTASLVLSVTGNKFVDSVRNSKNKSFSRFGAGIQFNLAQVKGLNIGEDTELSIVLGYLFSQSNPLLSTYRGETFSYVYPIGVNTQLMRYLPWQQFKNSVDMSSFQVGFHSSFLKNVIGIDIYTLFSTLNYSGLSTYKRNGFEMGIDFTYNHFGN